MMTRIACVAIRFLSLALLLVQLTVAQSPAQAESGMPRLVRFSGSAKGASGTPLSGVVGITFALYSEQAGGTALWLETQNITADSNGRYTVLLGSTKPDGLPAELFTSEQARWLAVQIAGEAEQSRVLLVAVPYALKAADAETIGGLPPSAFVLATPPTLPASTISQSSQAPTAAPLATGTTPVTTAGGIINKLAKFDAAADITNSVIFDNGANVGIGNTAPAAKLDVSGGATVRGLLYLPVTGTATATAGKNSQALNLAASAFNSGTGAAVSQNFRWQAEPVGNDTSSPSGTVNLLFSAGPSSPVETGLNIASNGQITFATGQTFPGTGSGNGTVTSVGSGAGLTGGPITTSGTLSIATAGVSNAMLANPSLTVSAGTDLTGGGSVALGSSTTLNLDITKVPQLNAANTFTGNQTINGSLSAYFLSVGDVSATGNLSAGGQLSATGLVSGSSFYIGESLFGSGSFANGTVALGFAGASYGSYNTSTGFGALYQNGGSGNYNTASGAYALYYSQGSQNTANGFYALHGYGFGSGSYNTASGSEALYYNYLGNYNTASGAYALYSNNADYNTASGYAALYFNTGSNNTASGYHALYSNTAGYENTAVGVNAADHRTTDNGLACFGYDTCGGTQNLHNAGAFGTRATVEVSDAIVLGSVAGVNGATATTRVGIGTTKPTNLLTLGQGFGPSISDGWATYSSRRWKTNIQPLHNALGMVEQLRGVSYNLKDSGKHEIGVIAEEVGEVVPEVVSYEENRKDARGVDYSRLTALLIEAVKQQQRQIKSQQQQIARLNGKVGVLEATSRTAEHVAKSPATTRSSAIKTHGLASERTKYASQQGN